MGSGVIYRGQCRHKLYQAERSECGNLQRDPRGDVPEGIAADIPVSGGVRQLAYPDAIEHDQEDAREGTAQSGVLRGEVIGDRSSCRDRGDRVLENHLVSATHVHDHGKAIEVLDAGLEVPPVEQVNRNLDPLSPRVVQEDILNIRG